MLNGDENDGNRVFETFAQVAEVAKIDVLITDSDPDADLLDELWATGLDVRVAPVERP